MWKAYWQRADLKWHRYDPDPEVDTINDFIKLVEEDEFGCFFWLKHMTSGSTVANECGAARPMSYIVSIKRLISKADLLFAIDGDEEFTILSEGDGFVDLVWSVGEEKTSFHLVQSEITVTTSSDKALKKYTILLKTRRHRH